MRHRWSLVRLLGPGALPEKTPKGYNKSVRAKLSCISPFHVISHRECAGTWNCFSALLGSRTNSRHGSPPAPFCTPAKISSFGQIACAARQFSTLLHILSIKKLVKSRGAPSTSAYTVFPRVRSKKPRLAHRGKRKCSLHKAFPYQPGVRKQDAREGSANAPY